MLLQKFPKKPYFYRQNIPFRKNRAILIVALAAMALAFTPASEAVPKTTLQGAWQFIGMEKGEEVTQMLLFSGDYFSWTTYKTEDGAFIATKGGSWKTSDDQLELTYEFSTADTAQVGQTESWMVNQKGAEMQLSQNISGRDIIWRNIEAGITTDLTGSWLISGRMRNGEISRRDTNRPRKTMKILTGTRFQWIAYNTATKQFFGTGGGSYTAEDGKYVEHIEFFSRDNSRVGASLEFNFEIKDGDWHHSGKSSKGDPMYEIWSLRE